MTVPAGTARIQYFGSGSAGPFAFNFALYDQTHLKLVKTDLLGVDTTLVLTTDYTVAVAADFASATVTLVVPLAGTGIPVSSEKLTITRDPPVSQLVQWARNDPFPFSTHQRAADLAVMLIDRLNEKIGRSLLLPESSAFSGLTLPNPDPLLFLRWNALGTALENMSVASPGLLVVSAFIQTLLDDVNAAAARTTLGAGDVTGPASSVASRLASFNGTTGKLLQDSGVTTATVGAGKQTIWVPASAMVATAGAAGPSAATVAPNQLSLPILAFDPAGFEAAFFVIGTPKSWNLGSLTFQAVWSHTATVTNFGVTWQLTVVPLSDTDTLNTVISDGAQVTDTGGSTDSMYITAESGAITMATPAPAQNDVIFFRLARLVADAGDTMTIDARLIGVRIFYTTNANTDV